ncbi:hypothetical protein D3C85_480660 [compost metagenome]
MVKLKVPPIPASAIQANKAVNAGFFAKNFGPSTRTKARFQGAFGSKAQKSFGPHEVGPQQAASNLTMMNRAGMAGQGAADYFWRQANATQRAWRGGAAGAGIIGTGMMMDGINGGYGD